MGGKTVRMSSTKLEALQLQSSAKGVVIPWIRGVARVATNLAWANGFKPVPHTQTQGGKGGQKVQTTNYTYEVSMYLGLCHGPIIDTPRVWVGKEIHGSPFSGSLIATTTETYAVPASGAMSYTASQSAWLALVSITVPSGTGTRMLVQDVDFSRSGRVITVLDNALRGVTLSITYQYATGTIAHGALVDLGMSFRVGEIGQTQWSGFSAWPSEALAYSGLAALAALDYDLGDSATPPNHMVEVVAPLAYHLGSTVPDVDPALFIRELLLDQRAGAAFPGQYLGDFKAWSDYCVSAGLLISPALTQQTSAAEVIKQAADLTCAAISTTGGKLQIIPRADAAESGNGRTYTPNLTPVYDLDDECYVPSGAGQSPVKYRLKSSATRYNVWSLEYNNRDNAYANEPVDAIDEADIEVRGRVTNPSTVSAPWICNGVAARKAVQLMMQRSVSVLTEYEVPVPVHFSLIDLVDPLTLTDSTLGYSKLPVLVIGIDEDADGSLKLLCEDYPIGAASAPAYASPSALGFQQDYNAPPGTSAGAVVFEAPYARTKTGLAIMVAVQSSGNAAWGGAQVWISLDGTNYRMQGTVYGPARTGQLTAAFNSGSSTLQVGGVTDGQLNSGSALDAANLVTLCYVGGTTPKFLAYQTATLTGAGAYTLSSLVQGAYDSDASATSPIGAPFARVDGAVIQSDDLDPSYIGATIYIKLCSFNVYGGAVQSLADVSPITYTVTGSQYLRKGRDMRVVARGQSDTQSPAGTGLYDLGTKTTLAGGARSYSMARISRRPPYAVAFLQTYDVYGNGANTSGRNAATLANDLNGSGADVIVVVWTHDEPQTNRLTSGLAAAMYRCGASSAVFGSPNFKSRSAYLLVGIPGCGQGGGVEMYNGDADASTNAWAMLDFHIGPDGYRVTGGSTPRTLQDYSYTGDMNASAGTVLISSGLCVVNGGTITGTATSAAWGNGSAYSVDGYTGGAFASASPAQIDQYIQFGLSQVPGTTDSFTDINYAIYCRGVGQDLQIYESGTARGSFGTYAAGDVLAVVYDGARVKYLKNGTVLRTVAAAADLKLYFDSAFYQAGSLANVQFGPLSPVTGIGTNQLVDGAATAVYQSSMLAGPVTLTSAA